AVPILGCHVCGTQQLYEGKYYNCEVWKEFMPDPTKTNGVMSLSDRFDTFAQMVEGIVLRGIEHPACELKRTVTLSKDDLTDRLDFVRLIQGLANSHAGTECLVVIGADQ